MATIIYWPAEAGAGGDSHLHIVADATARAALTPSDGDLALQRDNDSLYAWDQGGSAWIAIAGAAALSPYLLKAGGTMTGALNLSTLTASRALVTDGSKNVAASATTATELGYVAGVTSGVQSQLNAITTAYQAADTALTAAKVAKAGDTMTGALTLAADPSGALEAATKQYVDSVAAGLDVKPSVKAATTANITLSAAQTIDGVSIVAGDRVLVRSQSTTAQNGIYVAASGAWTRATDMDAWGEVPGSFCFVEQGTLYADTAHVCTANAGGTLGSTSITWSQFAGAGTYTTDGQGIEFTGTQLGLELDGTTLSKSATGVKVADLGIADAQIATAAAIAHAKMAPLSTAKAMVTDGSGKASAHASTTATEVGYLAGVTSALQTQLTARVTNPMSAAGDMIYGGVSGAPTNLATGATAGLLHGGNASTPTWSKLVNADVDAAAAIAGSKIVVASGSTAGVVDSNAASWSGAKTFTDGALFGNAASSGTGVTSSSRTNTYYEEITFASTISNVASTAQSITFKLTRVGRQVTIACTVLASGTKTNTTNPGVDDVLPVAFRPTTAAIVVPWLVRNNGTFEAGWLEVGTGGALNFYRNTFAAAAWTGSGTCTIYNGSASYSIV